MAVQSTIDGSNHSCPPPPDPPPVVHICCDDDVQQDAHPPNQGTQGGNSNSGTSKDRAKANANSNDLQNSANPPKGNLEWNQERYLKQGLNFQKNNEYSLNSQPAKSASTNGTKLASKTSKSTNQVSTTGILNTESTRVLTAQPTYKGQQQRIKAPQIHVIDLTDTSDLASESLSIRTAQRPGSDGSVGEAQVGAADPIQNHNGQDCSLVLPAVASAVGLPAHLLCVPEQTPEQKYREFRKQQQQIRAAQHLVVAKRQYQKQYQQRYQQPYQARKQLLRQQTQVQQGHNSPMYQIYANFSPLFTPQSQHSHPLYPMFCSLRGNFTCTGLHSIILKMKIHDSSAGAEPLSDVSRALSYAFNQNHVQGLPTNPNFNTIPFQYPSAITVLGCRVCFEQGVFVHYPHVDSDSIHFPSTVTSMLTGLYKLQQHLMRCVHLSLNVKQFISSSVWHPNNVCHPREFEFLQQLSVEYNLFPREPSQKTNPVVMKVPTPGEQNYHRNISATAPTPIPAVSTFDEMADDSYACNIFPLQVAMSTTSMTFRGRIRQDVCDMLDDDVVVGDDPFCLLAMESVEVIRIERAHVLPNYRCFFEYESVTDDEQELFILQCRHCGGHRKEDGSRNDDSMVLLHRCDNSEVLKDTVIQFMSMAVKHLPKCLKGDLLRRWEALYASRNSECFFQTLAASFRRYLPHILEFVKRLQIHPFLVPPLPDKELWASYSIHDHREMIKLGGDSAMKAIDIMGSRRKEIGVPGSAVEQFLAYPRRGLLHGGVGIPTVDDMKLTYRKRSRPPDEQKQKSNQNLAGSMVSNFSIQNRVPYHDGDTALNTVYLENLA